MLMPAIHLGSGFCPLSVVRPLVLLKSESSGKQLCLRMVDGVQYRCQIIYSDIDFTSWWTFSFCVFYFLGLIRLI